MSESRTKESSAGTLCIVLTLLGWSSVPLFLKYFTGFIDAWTANGWRYGLSALIWAPVLIWFHLHSRLPAGLWRAALVPSLINCAGQCCFAWSPYYIDPGLLTFMLRFQIIFVAFGAYLLFPAERPVLRSRTFWMGVAVVFGGSIGVCLLGPSLPTGSTLLGIVLAILAGIFFGGYSLAVRHYMHGMPSVFSFAAISQYTALGVIVIMLTLGDGHGTRVFDMTGLAFGLLAASAVVGIALAHVLYYASIARLGVAVSAGVILLQPFLTGAASFFVFGERLTIAQWISGFVAVGGALAMLHVQRRLSRLDDAAAETAVVGPNPSPSEMVAEPGSIVAAAACETD